jgi:translocation protein SEC62
MDETEKKHVDFCKAIRGKGLKEHSSVLGGKQVQYFSGRSFILFLMKNKDKLSDAPDPIATEEEATAYGNKLLRKGLIIRVQCHPDEVNKKRPKRVYLSKTRGQMSREELFTWDQKVAHSSWNKIWTGLIFVGVLAACLFRAWPLWMKIGLWYISVALLVAITSLILISYSVWFLLFLFGHTFWLFPNLLDDSAGIIGCFFPLYYYTRREDGWGMFAFRLVLMLTMVGVAVLFYYHPNLVQDI